MLKRLLSFDTMFIACSLAVELVSSSTAKASLPTGTQIWNLNVARLPIDGQRQWEAYLELQPRFDLNTPTRGRILFRPGIWYNISPTQSVTIGALDLTDIEFNFKEYRLWEQYQRSDSIGFFSRVPLSFMNRTRLEQRFVRGSTDVGLRFRHMLRAQWPIANQPRWSWVFFDEIFVGINQNPSQPSPGFDQNRAFAGIRKDFEGSGLSLEVGYMNQVTREVMNHVPFIFFHFR